jgi:hypothetical protein
MVVYGLVDSPTEVAQVQHPIAQPRLGVHLSTLPGYHLTVGLIVLIVLFSLLLCRTLGIADLLLLSQGILVLD